MVHLDLHLTLAAAQVVVTVGYAALVTFRLMGRDYEAEVCTTGHIGFGIGIASNAVANMEAMTVRYGTAPRSMVMVPIVGAFFIDLLNPILITLTLALLR